MNEASMKNDDEGSSSSCCCNNNPGSTAEVARLKRMISQMEVEIKANRGTISRLAAEAEKQHLSAVDGLSQVQHFIKEKEAFEVEKRQATDEFERLKIALSETEAKLADSQARIANLERELRVRGLQNEDFVNVKRNHTKFKNKLINLLFESCENVGEDGAVDEEGIIKEIIGLKDRHKSNLEEKETLVTKYHQKTSEEVERLEDVIKDLERDFIDCRNSVIRLEQDKQKFLGFITQLKSIVGIAEADVDLGLDRTLEVILLRTNQLSRNETTSLAEKKSQVYTLQRKLKSLNENMDSKVVFIPRADPGSLTGGGGENF
ncbi:hypothetical protein HELRODRAFT_159839 [Helobdella robusta]|uniref:Uncharacterized protein n=1 Tax=Helobdella robusta TaxID=6412 RepID=T1EPG7_HELRO|nr:hypothetical protein HELRODRAFT_159839 [Helobdella robusta]ESO13206.1 hypothetical protein HELRODRAFT_159839 [Helobdella robusta]